MKSEPIANSTIQVLLVDDRPENLVALRASLEPLGYDFVTARSGAEALRQVLDHDFAVIVLDVDMPEMNGFEAADLIRRRERSRHTPIIFLTAYDISPGHVFRGYLVGAVDYLIKPYAAEILRSKVAFFIDLFRVSREHQLQLAETQRLNQELDQANHELLQSRQALQVEHDLLEKRVEERTAELEAANQALRHENAERIHAEGRLKASLREKELLLREIYHRVKNNLQVVASLLSWQADFVQDEQTIGVLGECRSRVQSMALIHEKLYLSQDHARIEIADYIRSLVSHMRMLYHRSRPVNVQVQADDVFLGIDTAIPCGLIINELVSNSFKHAFPAGREGEIRIELRPDENGHYVLTVADNGIGLPASLEMRKAESLGLQIVNTLTEQLDGELQVNTANGTTIKIVFPIPSRQPGLLVANDD